MKALRSLTVLFGLTAAALAQGQSLTTPWDHVHFMVPDPPAALEWYAKHFGAEPKQTPPAYAVIGQTRLDFAKSATAKPSTGTSVDHIGFSVPDLDATMKQLAAAGVKVVTPTREVTGLFKIAFVEDPWGTRIEVVEDSETLGFHHVHLRVPDPEKTLTWYQATFGGVRSKLRGGPDGVKYGNVWLLALKGDGTPTQGHVIDHIGWRTADIAQAVQELKGRGVAFSSEPKPITFLGEPIVYSFIEGPSGTRIEFMQR